MTIGIYKLNFPGTTKVYIGQSINIEARLISHRSSMRNLDSTPKLQKAYNEYGVPSVEIILECSISELDSAETEAIQIYNSVDNGFNSLKRPGPPNLHGEDGGTATESNETYLWVLNLLVNSKPTLTKREISELTGVSLYVIRHIAFLESHTWMQEASPIDYAKLIALKDTKYLQNRAYPRIVSPTGEVFSVGHVTNFAIEHGLLQPKLSDVLFGNRKHHKGWHLEGSILRKYPPIQDSVGNVYNIEYGKAAEFSRTYGIPTQPLNHILNGKKSSYKGWSLVSTLNKVDE